MSWLTRKKDFHSDTMTYDQYMRPMRAKWGLIGSLRKKFYAAQKAGDRKRMLEIGDDLAAWRDSEDRLREMIYTVAQYGCPPAVFWPVWLKWWSGVDLTGFWRTSLPNIFKFKGGLKQALKYFDEDQRAFYDTLPEAITVYRGCDRSHLDGVSWTTDFETAVYFQTGGRYGRPPDPIVATATIRKCDIFYCCDSRNEKEIVCKPAQIDKVEKIDAKRVARIMKKRARRQAKAWAVLTKKAEKMRQQKQEAA
jgi:hypothetical protein